MALTRKFLAAMNVEGDVADQIISEHSATTAAMKTEIGTLKDKAEKADSLEQELNELKSKQGTNTDYKAKFEKVTGEFDAYKKQTQEAAAQTEKRGLYRDLLKEAGVDAKRIDSVLKVSDLSDVAVKDGAIDGREKLLENIKADWSDFIVQTTTEGAQVATPVKEAGGTGVTKAEFAKMSLRQRNDLYENDRATYDALVKD